MKIWKQIGLMAFASYAWVGSAAAATDTTASADTQSSQEIDIKKVSEAFGHFIGKNLKSSGLGFDNESFIQGIRNGFNDKPAPMTEKEYEQQMVLLQEKAFKKVSEDNLKAATNFLENNAKEKGVIEIEPGRLQYMIVKQGTGSEVKDHDTPQIQYTGQYIDGTVFGSSQDTGGPISIPIDQTIPGFSKGLKGMKEGEIRKIFVHPDLGYGKTGHLPPNSLLIFEVELIKANNPESSILDNMDEDDEGDEDEDDRPTPAGKAATQKK